MHLEFGMSGWILWPENDFSNRSEQVTGCGCTGCEVLSNKYIAPQVVHQNVSKNQATYVDGIGMSTSSLGAFGCMGGWETVLWRWPHPHCTKPVQKITVVRGIALGCTPRIWYEWVDSVAGKRFFITEVSR